MANYINYWQIDYGGTNSMRWLIRIKYFKKNLSRENYSANFHKWGVFSEGGARSFSTHPFIPRLLNSTTRMTAICVCGIPMNYSWYSDGYIYRKHLKSKIIRILYTQRMEYNICQDKMSPGLTYDCGFGLSHLLLTNRSITKMHG